MVFSSPFQWASSFSFQPGASARGGRKARLDLGNKTVAIVKYLKILRLSEALK
jgi:hypothetical protein